MQKCTQTQHTQMQKGEEQKGPLMILSLILKSMIQIQTTKGSQKKVYESKRQQLKNSRSTGNA